MRGTCSSARAVSMRPNHTRAGKSPRCICRRAAFAAACRARINSSSAATPTARGCSRPRLSPSSAPAAHLGAIGVFVATHKSDLLAVARDVIAGALDYSATDVFKAGYRLQALKRAAAAEFARIDLLAVPTAPTIYTVAQIEAEPLKLN